MAAGGERDREGAKARGNFLKPTVFTDVQPRMRIAQEEIFGPVLSVLRFATRPRRLRVANGTTTGWRRASGPATSPAPTRWRGKVQAGVVWINCFNEFDDAAPFGGYKESGWGRDLPRTRWTNYTAAEDGLDAASGGVAMARGTRVTRAGVARGPGGASEGRRAEVERWLDQHSVTQVKIAGVDLDGVLRGKYVSRDKFRSISGAGLGFCDVVFGWDIADELYDNAQVTGWHTGYPDLHARVDLATRRLIPWEPDTAAFLLDFVEADGTDYGP